MFLKKWLQLLVLAGVVLGLVATALVGIAAVLIYPNLPSLEAMTDYRPKVPLRVYTEDGHLIGEFGEERRALVSIQDVPQDLKHAILAAEDERFYTHGGVDTIGILRAAIANVTAGGFKEGASTITMQLARNFYLSREKTATRKLNEALLAIKIEHSLTKDQILEIYINQIYLGQRAYGYAAAAQVYFGKPLSKLNVAELATLAGLPKAPSRYNPLVNPKRAMARQQYVLRRMNALGFIDDATYQAALDTPVKAKKTRQALDLSADYVAEIARQAMFERYKDDIYSSGMKVYTTLRKANQEAANEALIQGLLTYDRRHGYRGPEKQLKAPEGATDNTWMDEALDEVEAYPPLLPALVMTASPKQVEVYTKYGEVIDITGAGLELVKKQLNEKEPEKRKLVAGALVRIMKLGEVWHISQLPKVEAALVGLDSEDGAVRALVGGFNFERNKFNHATQAWRQPGSSFKPFIYSAALEKGYTPATLIEDEPIYISSTETGSGQAWEPRNYDNKFEGPIRIRTALTKSKNMVSVRILQGIGVSYAQDYITRFGFSTKDHPAYLAMALGSGSVTAWQLAGAYAVFANGGFRVRPYIISRIEDSQGKVVDKSRILRAGQDAPRVLDPRNAFLMTSMMQDVARVGTAAKARQLGRSDLAGKTGTTNNQFDAWFAGYNPKHVAVAWIGYDQPKSLGNNETGGQAALPIWINYMAEALKGMPDQPMSVPPGINSIKVNPYTGLRSVEGEGGYYEYFYDEFPPADTLPEPEYTEEPEPITPFPGHPSPGAGAALPAPVATPASAPAGRVLAETKPVTEPKSQIDPRLAQPAPAKAEPRRAESAEARKRSPLQPDQLF